MQSIPFEKLEKFFYSKNLILSSVISADSALSSLGFEKENLKKWQDLGYAGEMSFMTRSVELFTNPRNFLNEVNSIILFAVPYVIPKMEDPICENGFGRVARYARGMDYHTVLKDLLLQISKEIEDSFGGVSRVFTDAVPLLERGLLASSGLGFIGKSSMNIIPGVGTYFFIAEILTSLEIKEVPILKNNEYSCKTCSLCINKCPTGAFVKPKVLDARKCISYLTIEKRGEHDLDDASLIGDWIFGCDVCQEVCPFNMHGKEVRVFEKFKEEYGVGGKLYIPQLLKIRDSKTFKEKFSHTPLMRTKREGLLRNGISVLYNQKATEFYEDLIEVYKTDPSLILREHSKRVLLSFLQFESGLVSKKIETALLI